MHKPSWFSDDHIMVSAAMSCGLSKKGRLRRKIDHETGQRIQIEDPETGAMVDAIDDQLLDDMRALRGSNSKERAEKNLTPTLRFVPSADIETNCAVPIYYDKSLIKRFHEELEKPTFDGFKPQSIGTLVANESMIIRGGHGSPSQEERVGDVPYIKVSDLRAGLVNINPTNRVPRAIAERFWRGKSSGLEAFDLVCPERTSKNIGDFCVLMPGQEQVLFTKEIIVIRPGPRAPFDGFFLLWAMSLSVVRDQWKRIVFMQTNREDVGQRYLEIEIPVPPDAETAREVSAPFREYYTTLATARQKLNEYLMSADSPHHFFIGGADLEEDDDPDGNGTE